MYHYSNNHIQPLYQNEYPACSFIDTRDDQPTDVPIQNKCSETVLPNDLALAISVDAPKPSESSLSHTKYQEKVRKKGALDTSNFTIEERLVASVWVHERKRTRISFSQIKRDFRQRFGRDPPTKNTLLVWERKLFSTGSVCDAPRTGRPARRKALIEQVAASVKSEPSLSLRARATVLKVPRTTLRTILHKDLPHILPDISESSSCTNKTTKADKNKPKKMMKRAVKKVVPSACPPLPAHAPPPPHHYHIAPHSHHYMMQQSIHTHGYL